METKKCPLCGNNAHSQAQNLLINYICTNCSRFSFAIQIVKDGIKTYFDVNGSSEVYDKKHLIAGWMYEFNRTKVKPHVFNDVADFVEILEDNRMPQTPTQRLERFLVNLCKLSDRFDIAFGIASDNGLVGISDGDFLYPFSIAYSRSSVEVENMLQWLESFGYSKLKHNSKFFYYISPKGFERAEQLMSTNIDSTSVFVAMAFEDDLLEAYKKAIKPACKDCGFNALIISDKHHNNGITDEIIVEIKKSKFVIVDFTYNNNGAYWEAGYAQGLGHTVIRCCKEEWFISEGKRLGKDNPLHFDVKHYNTILWKSHEHLTEILKSNIRANFSDAKLED